MKEKNLELIIVWAACKDNGKYSEESKEAVKLLREYGFGIHSIPIIGLWEPTAILPALSETAIVKHHEYKGIKEIRAYLEKHKAQLQSKAS